MIRPSSHRLVEPVLAFLTSCALAIGLTWPVALHPVALLAGHPGNDNWNHAWGYWWVGRSVLAGDWPDHIDLLGFPHGGTLYFIDTAQALLSLPVQVIWGPAAAYNAVLVGGLALSTFFAWLLARRITGDALSAAIAGVIYGASPLLLAQSYNGITETVCTGWVPLTLWAMLKVVARPTWGRAIALGVSAALCTATSWYHGLFVAISGGVVLLWIGAGQPYVVDWRRTLTRLMGAAVFAGVLIAPLFLAFTHSLAAPDAIVQRDPGFVWDSLIRHNITDLAAMFSLSQRPSPDLFAEYGEDLIIAVHLGWVGLLLSGVALWTTRRYRELAPWLWTGVVFFLLSLGPYLNIGGEYLTIGGHRVPLPFLAVFQALPVFDRVSHPFRFVTGVSLALAVAGSIAVRHLLRRRSTLVRWAGITGLSALALAEVAWASPAQIPVPVSDARIPAAYGLMADDPTPGAVLDLPLTVPNLERAVYVWYQSAHARPVPWALNEPMPPQIIQNRLLATLIRMEAGRTHTLVSRLPELDMVVSGRTLVRQGYRYVVVHERAYPAFKRSQVVALLTGVFGDPQAYPQDDLLVWTIGGAS